jgi:hypothetical protein
MLNTNNEVDVLVQEDSLEIPFCNKVPNSELSRSDDVDEVCRVF